MFEIYLTKTAQDAMSRDDIYLLTQTMRIFNGLRLFILIADDIQRRGPDDVLNQKKYIELLLNHAANLNEVLSALEEDLFPRYRHALTNQAVLDGLTRWENRIKRKDETVRVLTSIRNKHAFHVAHDPFYPWKYLTEGPAAADKLIGVGETIQGSGWLFTWDTDLILAFLRDHALEHTGDLVQDYMKVKKIIDNASVDLYTLFQSIVDELLRNKIYMKGDKAEASRDYREDS
jgi:hypothetical protein